MYCFDLQVLHISSHVEMYNMTSLSFQIGVFDSHTNTVSDIGLIKDTNRTKEVVGENNHSVFGLPAPILCNLNADSSEALRIQVSPWLMGDAPTLQGVYTLPPFESLVASSAENWVSEVSCSPTTQEGRLPSLVVNICCKVSLVDGRYPFVQLYMQPRLVLTNTLVSVSLLIRTPMPYVFDTRNSTYDVDDSKDQECSVYKLCTNSSVEFFTPGPSVAVSARIADLPIAGSATGWVEGEWIIVPLDEKIPKPMRFVFPFDTNLLGETTGGMSFFVLEEDDITPELKEIPDRKDQPQKSKPPEARNVVFGVCNYAVNHIVDHAGNLLFEEVPPTEIPNAPRKKDVPSRPSSPLSVFLSVKHQRQITLLPGSSTWIRIVQSDDKGFFRKSKPFRLEDVALSEDEFVSIVFENGLHSHFYINERLTDFGIAVHLVPEFLIFNGSRHAILAKQLNQTPFLLDPLNLTPIVNEVMVNPMEISPIERDAENTIVVQFYLEDDTIKGKTDPIQVNKVGLRVCIVRGVNGEPLGSLAVQTVTGARDSRFVIKIGTLNLQQKLELGNTLRLFNDDLIRIRILWSEVVVKLKDTGDGDDVKYSGGRKAIKQYLEHNKVDSDAVEKHFAKERNGNKKQILFSDVAQIFLYRFTVDFQRMYKEDNAEEDSKVLSNERSQVLVKIQNVRLTDFSPENSSPIVFDSMSEKSFIDLCIRISGSLREDLVVVDLLDLNLAYGNGKAEQIVVNTGEDFVWRMLDLANRTMVATSELSGVDLDLQWNEETGTFSVTCGSSNNDVDDVDAGTFSAAPLHFSLS
jgi:hypothetical protein